MDIATRFHPRVRPQGYLDRERQATEEVGAETSEPLPRRRAPRTSTDPTVPPSSHTFRKPLAPASATRAANASTGTTHGLDTRSSLSQRRRSGLREAIRVTSGPREYPVSPGKRFAPTTSAAAPSPTQEPDRGFAAHIRPSLLSTTSDSLLSNSNNDHGARQPSGGVPAATMPQHRSRFSFGGGHRGQHVNQNDVAKGSQDPASTSNYHVDAAHRTPDELPESLGFVPTMNFDDFQNSIVDPSWTSPIVGHFPRAEDGRTLPSSASPAPSPRADQKEQGDAAKANGYASWTWASKGGAPLGSTRRRKEDHESVTTGQDRPARTSSLRARRAGAAPVAVTRQAAAPDQQAQVSQLQHQAWQSAQTSVSQPNLLARTRRQSTQPQASSLATQTVPAVPSSRPRKSLGPGMHAGMLQANDDGSASRKTSGTSAVTATDVSLPASKTSLSRTSSLSNSTRRTQLAAASPGAPFGPADWVRLPNATAPAQSRASKAKSLQPPPRGQQHPAMPIPPSTAQGEQDTPVSNNFSRPVSKANPQGGARAHTPTSGGIGSNKRQSTTSGRASGLGARTISPTDARRLKRMSMMQDPPPLPSAYVPKGPPTPQEEYQSLMWPARGQGHTNTAGSSNQEIVRDKEKESHGSLRLAQPSPSLIPRKISTGTPTSARASPERAFASSVFSSGLNGANGSTAHGLSSKSSYQSLQSNSTASGSRLPTPRSGRPSSHNSNHTPQYGGEDGTEMVPPVPAIPKAYESPKEQDQPFFTPGSFKNSYSVPSPGRYTDGPQADELSGVLPSSSAYDLSNTSNAPRREDNTTLHPPGTVGAMPTTRKLSAEMHRPAHFRAHTTGDGSSLQNAAAGESDNASARPTSARRQPDPAGRRNNNLQPLRLPPLNLMPLQMPNTFGNNRTPHNAMHTGSANAVQPRPSGELENRALDYAQVQTPEPGFKRGNKTPTTPMTASKATFRRGANGGRAEGWKGDMRSSSSHFALRDVVTSFGRQEGRLDDDRMTRLYFDDDDADGNAELTFNGTKEASDAILDDSKAYTRQSAITPFASGSLPRGSGDWPQSVDRVAPVNTGYGRPSGEDSYQDDYDLGGTYTENLHFASAKPQGPRPRIPSHSSLKTTSSSKRASPPIVPDSAGYGTVMSPSEDAKAEARTLQKDDKETGSSGGGLRRKLSLGWRRSSSKAAQHAENANKSRPPSGIQSHAGHEVLPTMEKERTPSSGKLQKRNPAASAESMPPPKLPASAISGTRERKTETTIPIPPRLSLEERAARRKSALMDPPSVAQTVDANGNAEPKTRSLHSSNPQPTSTQRSTSWGTGIAGAGGLTTARLGTKNAASRQKATTSTISAIAKDKDDVAADDEMRKLSQKRRDVDTAARESEALRARAVPRTPSTPDNILRDRNCTLNIFERGEIVDFEKEGVYFTGTKTCRKIIGSLNANNPNDVDPMSKEGKSGNYGYDDERGDYNIVFGDHLAYRYEVIDILGKGSFGQVVRCVDHKEGGVVAIKIIRNKKRFHQQALVEVGILGKLKEWDPESTYATLSITSSFYFRSHLCIVTPCLSINLYEFIRAHNFTGFSLPLIRRFSRQLLACLTLLETKRIIHCDLKPENILLCEARKADVRVIDFGSSCREEEKVYTYIQSRFYRSPEVILGSSYGLGIDMWSFGCILAELWTGYPIFPGENEQEQLACIMEIFGPPDRHLVERCTRKKLFFDSVGKPRVTVSSKGRRRRPSSKTLSQALKTDDEAFLDFITRSLRWDPERRMKPHEAVSHPFITGLPFSQRPGIPEEARRAARAKTNAIGGSGSNPGTGTSSPVKRVAAAGTTTLAVTPSGKDRLRALPDTPQTAVRSNHAQTFNSNTSATLGTGSPSKAAIAANRRHSTVIPSAGSAAAMASSKRASNGLALGNTLGYNSPAGSVGSQLRAGQGSIATANGGLAPVAVREVGVSNAASAAAVAAAAASMSGGGGGGGSQARWRL